MVGKRPVRSVASKSLGFTTVMCMVLVPVTGRSGVGSWVLIDLMFFLDSLSWPFSVTSKACCVGLLGKVWDVRAEYRLVKDMRYMPEDGHLVANRL